MPARHLFVFFCTLKGNYVWRFHEVHTTIAPCLSTALTICLCVRSSQVWLFLQGLKVMRLGFYGIYPILHLCTGTQPRQSWETDCYMPGADQSGWWFGPEIGGEKASWWFPSSTPDHIYCLPSASCWKNFPTTASLVQAHMSSGGFTLVTMDDKFCFQDVWLWNLFSALCIVTFCQSFSWGNWSSGQPNLFLLCNLWWKCLSLFYYLTMVYCHRDLIWTRNTRKHIDQQGGQCWIRWYRTPKERPTWVQVWDPPRCILLFLIPGTGRPLLIELFRLRSQQNQRPHHEHDSSLSNWMSSVIVSFHVINTSSKKTLSNIRHFIGWQHGMWMYRLFS